MADRLPSPQGLDPSRKLPFVCLGSDCPHTCCGPFHGTEMLHAALDCSDLGNVLGDPDGKAETGPEISLFAHIRLIPADLARLQDAGLEHLIIRRGRSADPAHYLRLRPDGSCAALTKEKLCSIHPHRPAICRAFPFYIDLFAGLTMVASCPGIEAGESTVAQLEGEIRAAISMYEFWIEQIRRTAEPEE